jgi:hypothetical protein
MEKFKDGFTQRRKAQTQRHKAQTQRHKAEFLSASLRLRFAPLREIFFRP